MYGKPATILARHIELLWGNTTDTQNAPAQISISRSVDGQNWQRFVGPGPGKNKQSNCTRPTLPGGVVYSREFADGELTTRHLYFQIQRNWRTLGFSSDWADGSKLGSLNIYTKA